MVADTRMHTLTFGIINIFIITIDMLSTSDFVYKYQSHEIPFKNYKDKIKITILFPFYKNHHS